MLQLLHVNAGLAYLHQHRGQRSPTQLNFFKFKWKLLEENFPTNQAAYSFSFELLTAITYTSNKFNLIIIFKAMRALGVTLHSNLWLDSHLDEVFVLNTSSYTHNPNFSDFLATLANLRLALRIAVKSLTSYIFRL